MYYCEFPEMLSMFLASLPSSPSVFGQSSTQTSAGKGLAQLWISFPCSVDLANLIQWNVVIQEMPHQNSYQPPTPLPAKKFNTGQILGLFDFGTCFEFQKTLSTSLSSSVRAYLWWPC